MLQRARARFERLTVTPGERACGSPSSRARTRRPTAAHGDRRSGNSRMRLRRTRAVGVRRVDDSRRRVLPATLS